MEDIVLQKEPGLKQLEGQCTNLNVPKDFRAYAKQRIVVWREALLDRLYPGTLIITAEFLMSDDVVEKLVTQGKRFSSATDMLTRVRWTIGSKEFQALSPTPNDDGLALFIELQDIYNEYDKAHPANEDTKDKLDPTIR